MHKVKNFRSGRRPPLIYAVAICALASLNAPAQHVHGVIELGVVVEDGTVAVSLNAPLSDVVGFEHAPESDEQLELIRQAAAMLSNPNAMFGLADSASCTISGMSIDGPEYVRQHLADDAGAAESGHDHDEHEEAAGHEHDEHDEHEEAAGHDHDEHEEHEEAAGHEHDEHEEHEEAAAHDHDDHDDHDEAAVHDHDDAEQHAEVNANYEWVCANASDLDSLALRFTEGFTGVETIEIQILTAAGAQVLTLEGRATSVSLSRP